jgi:hypothetical protein
MAKIDKASVLYLHRPEGDYSCANCCLFLPTARRCLWFSARDVVQPYGACGLFVEGTAKQLVNVGANPLGKVTPVEAGYVENKPGYTCGRCVHFSDAKQDCEIVDKNSEGDDPGSIKAESCCNAWEKE